MIRVDRKLLDENLIAPCGLYCGECLGFQNGSCGGCISRTGLCLKYSKICNIYECCVIKKRHRFCSECKEFPCKRTDNFFDTPEWHDEIASNLKQIRRIGVKHFLTKQAKRVMELIKCAEKNGVGHCSQCERWPCRKLKREPLVPA
jgi:hypothetical protein